MSDDPRDYPGPDDYLTPAQLNPGYGESPLARLLDEADDLRATVEQLRADLRASLADKHAVSNVNERLRAALRGMVRAYAQVALDERSATAEDIRRVPEVRAADAVLGSATVTNAGAPMWGNTTDLYAENDKLRRAFNDQSQRLQLAQAEHYDRAVLVEVMVHHWPTTTSGCVCGWAVLGHSFPEHLADAYEARRGQ